jgi:hypothetical protein
MCEAEIGTSVASALEASLDAWSVEGHEASPILVAIARALARQLADAEPKEAAGLAKELRATVTELAPRRVDDASIQLVARLSTAVRDAKKLESGDARAKGGRGRKAVGDSVDAVAATRRRRSAGG